MLLLRASTLATLSEANTARPNFALPHGSSVGMAVIGLLEFR